jgi:hypothetical protein
METYSNLTAIATATTTTKATITTTIFVQPYPLPDLFFFLFGSANTLSEWYESCFWALTTLTGLVAVAALAKGVDFDYVYSSSITFLLFGALALLTFILGLSILPLLAPLITAKILWAYMIVYVSH